MAVIFRVKKPTRRLTLGKELLVVPPIGSARRQDPELVAVTEAGANHRHGDREVEGVRAVGEDLGIGTLHWVKAEEEGEFEGGFSVSEGQGERRLAATAVTGDGHLEEIGFHVLGEGQVEAAGGEPASDRCRGVELGFSASEHRRVQLKQPIREDVLDIPYWTCFVSKSSLL